MTVATTECSVEKRVERGVREVDVTTLTVPAPVYRDGNRRRVKKDERTSQVILWYHIDLSIFWRSMVSTRQFSQGIHGW